MLAFTFFPALIQLCAFFFLLVLLGAISAMHLFKMGHPTNDDPFGGLWTSFLAMYQIFTGEDWTNSLYIITSRDSEHNMAWLGAIFIIGWFIISSILVLNMFIARVDESLSLPDGRRRQIQVINFLHRKRSLIEQNGSAVSGSGAHSGNSPTRDDWPDTSLTKAIDGFLYHEQHRKEAMLAAFPAPIPRTHSRYTTWIFNLRTQFYTTWSNLSASQRYQARSKRLLKSFVHQVYYPIKLGCATLVIPDNDSHLAVANIFTIFIYMSIVAQVVITCITVPMYRRAYFQQHVYTVANWFVWTDLAFVSLWTLEGLLKAIAGGLFRGEHAYLRGWNLIDAIVVATSWLSVLLSLYDFGLLPAQAIIASFKALRILRLLTINKKVMREVTLVFRRGRYKILTCFVVSLTLLVPFALLGLNLFMGQARMCNDSSISNLDTCLGEYASSAAPSVLIPRSVIKPYYSFDNFGESFYTLFLIVSQEGWTDVMYWARGITIGSAAGDTSHSTSNMNALFFVIFNFCGTIFVVALFAAVLIQNYTEATGVAYMTRDQRIWDQKLRMLRRLRPSRRPSAPSQTRTWRRWCYDCATTGKGKWQKGVVALFMLYMSILCIDMYPTKKNISLARGMSNMPIVPRASTLTAVADVALVISMIALFSNTLIRLFGLSVQFFFKRPWDCFGFVLLPAGVISSVTHIILPQSTAAHVIKSIAQPAIALLAIPTIGTFRDLLNIAFASIPLVSTLLITWFVLLLFFAIGLTQAFGLTRFGPNETGYVNFRTVPNALILLFRMTLGEGRTKIMEDFASIVPPYCTFGERALESDCGDPTLARVLFITWKMLSIYLFTSLFVSLVFDSFSYVYEALDLKTGPLTQEDLRHFKNAWAVADPRATGYITPASLVRFTNLIEGQLSLRVYPEDFSVLTLRKQCQHLLPLSPGELDLAKLNQRLAEMPVKEIRERRIVMHQYRKEILMKHESNLGISMQAALITLLHYKFAGNNDYLK